jgi:isopenicillin N synthase-like dioxygenase
MWNLGLSKCLVSGVCMENLNTRYHEFTCILMVSTEISIVFQVDKITFKSNDFFQLPVERKATYKRRKEEGNDGWVTMEMEQ